MNLLEKRLLDRDQVVQPWEQINDRLSKVLVYRSLNYISLPQLKLKYISLLLYLKKQKLESWMHAGLEERKEKNRNHQFSFWWLLSFSLMQTANSFAKTFSVFILNAYCMHAKTTVTANQLVKLFLCLFLHYMFTHLSHELAICTGAVFFFIIYIFHYSLSFLQRYYYYYYVSPLTADW